MYEPFGEPKAAGKLLLNRHKEELLHVPFGFTGEAHDFYSGRIYLRARYYDPATARMLTKDTHWNVNNMIYSDDSNNGIPSIKAIRQSTNLYTYALNNPTRYIDPSGNVTFAIGGSAAAAFIVKAGVSAQIAIDGYGNVGLVITLQGGGGTPAANAGGCVTITNEDKVKDLEKFGAEGGGSLWGGAEIVIGDGYQGINLSASISIPIPEIHGEGSYSFVFPLAGEMAIEAKEKLKEEIEKLSEEDEARIEERSGISLDDLL